MKCVEILYESVIIVHYSNGDLHIIITFDEKPNQA